MITDQRSAWVVANIGNLFIAKGLYPKAIEYLKRSLEVDAGSAFSHERLAKAIKEDEEERKKADSIVRSYKQGKQQLQTLHPEN